MKTFAILAASLAVAFSSFADRPTLEELSSHLFTNAAIVWQAPIANLPKSFWTFKIIRSHIFPQATISNAIVLGGIQAWGFPEASTNNTCIADDCHCSCAIHCIFSIYPPDASMCFSSPLQTSSTQKIPDDKILIKWAWYHSYQLGVDPATVAEEGFTSHFNTDTNGNSLTNEISGRGVFLSRVLDGTKFMNSGNDVSSSEGFWIEFGSFGLVRNFSLRWPNLERHKQSQTATVEQIIRCIHAHKTFVMPESDEDYFTKLKKLANAKKLTISKITPYYGEGIFGEVPTNGATCNFVMPFALLKADADFGDSHSAIVLYSPLISSDVSRLLGKKSP
jgi:hypothetical protein